MEPIKVKESQLTVHQSCQKIATRLVLVLLILVSCGSATRSSLRRLSQDERSLALGLVDELWPFAERTNYDEPGNTRYVGLRTILPVREGRSLEQIIVSALPEHNQDQASKMINLKSQPNQEKRLTSNYAYVMAPLSDQLMEIDRNYLLTNDSESPFAQVEYLGPNKLIWSPRNVSSRASSESKNERASWASIKSASTSHCKSLSSPWLLSKDHLDSKTGLLLRNCRGFLQVHRCEGACSSLVQPSVISQVGLKKECSCCNEGAFKKIKVRLDECYWPSSKQRISKEAGDDPQMSFMEVEIEEPSDCKCRPCDNMV